jgi:hypothetical protein
MLVSVAALTVKLMDPLTEPAVAVIVVEPAAAAVANPEPLIVATDGLLEVQFTAANACVLPSLKVPVAVNCWLVPAAMVLSGAETVIETRLADKTFSVAVSETAPTLAVIVVVPADTAVAMPLLSTVATAGEDEFQVTVVRSWVVPSLKVPVAMNWTDPPTGTLVGSGETDIAVRTAPLIVSDIVPVTLPDVAVMVTVPLETPVASPALLIAATGPLELHVTALVRSCELPSLKTPVAAN